MAWLALVAGIGLQSVVTSLLGLSMTRGDSLLLVFLAAVACIMCGRLRRPPGRPVDTMVKRSLAWLNLWTAILFIGFFLGVSMQGAPVVFGIESSLIPVMVVAWTAVDARRKGTAGPGTGQRAAASLLAFLGIALVAVLAHDNATDATALLSASALGVVASVGAAAVVILSRQLGRAGVSVSHVMNRRFGLTATLAIAGLTVLVPTGVIEGPHLGFGAAALGALASITAPMYLVQYAMQRLAAVSVTAAMATVPAITFVVSMICGSSVSAGALLLSLAIVPGSIVLLVAQRSPRRPARGARGVVLTGANGVVHAPRASIPCFS